MTQKSDPRSRHTDVSLLLGPEADVAPAESVSAAGVGQGGDLLLPPVTGQLTEPAHSS